MGRRGTWWPLSSGHGDVSAYYVCACGEVISLEAYAIDGETGRVDPVVVCGACSFSEAVCLEGWRGFVTP